MMYALLTHGGIAVALGTGAWFAPKAKGFGGNGSFDVGQLAADAADMLRLPPTSRAPGALESLACLFAAVRAEERSLLSLFPSCKPCDVVMMHFSWCTTTSTWA